MLKKSLPLFIFLNSSLLAACSSQNQISDDPNLSKITTHVFLPADAEKLLLPQTVLNQKAKDFLMHYFSPWTGQQIYIDSAQALQQEKATLQHYMENPGFAENWHRYDTNFFKALEDNMDLQHFPNRNIRAIVVANTNARVLPSDKPNFNDPTKPGKAYPFDEWQVSFVNANTPVRILQQTADGNFNLVIMPDGLAWLKTSSVAVVDQKFINNWQQHPFIVITSLHVSLKIKNEFYETVPLATLLPLLGTNKQNFKIGFATADENHHAKIKNAMIPVADARKFPFTLTAKNISQIADQLIGQAYDWGGYYGGYDCSSTLQKIFTVFGIWLPRGSTQQLEVGRVIDLSKMSRAQKGAFILQNAKPFLSLLGKAGHVTLYVGSREGVPYVYNTIWGLHTNFGKGRWVIGQTVVMPMNYGHWHWPLTEDLLSKVNQMAVIE